MLGDERINDGARVHVRGMAVVGLERLAALEVADQREIHRTAAGVEATPDLYPEEPWDAADLPFESIAHLLEIIGRLQPPQHDMPDHPA